MRPIKPIQPFAAPATCFVVQGVLDDAECAEVVGAATRQGFDAMKADYPPSYRDNDRMVLTSAALATALFDRLRAVLPEEITDEHGGRHRLVGLNERFRFCRYRGGQSFRIHQDGAHAPREGVRSRLTLQVYLDDGFRGGRTRFYRERRGGDLGAITPHEGTAAVFDHTLWHDGEPVTEGTKHVMRTDVMYERIAKCDDAGAGEPLVAEAGDVLRGHEGYVFAVRPLADGSLASGSRDRTIRTWERAENGAWTCARTLRGHDASVLSLLELPDGTLVSGSRDRTVRAWNVAGDSAGRVIATLGGAVLSLERLGDDTIACGAADGRIMIVDAHRANARELAGHTGWVWALARLADGRLVSGSDEGTVRLWEPSTGECLTAAAPGRGPAHALAVLADGTVAAAFADGHVVVYDASRDLLLPIAVHRAGEGELYAIHALAGGGFAAGGEESCARVHRGRLDALDAWETVRCGGFVRSICDVPRTPRLAVAGYDGCIRLS